ncbi:MAG: trigger factor, partial [Metallibacterium scheffleri]
AEFVRQFGIDSGELEDFRREVRANLERELGAAVAARLKGEVAGKLAAAHPDISVPRAMLEAEAQALARMGLAQDAQPAPERVESARAPARTRVIAALLMSEIARREGMQPEAQRVAALMASIASTYEDPQQVIELYQRDQQQLANLRTRVLEDQVAEWIAQHAQTTVRTMSFDELLRPGRNG